MLHKASYGSMARDDGNLLVSPEEYPAVVSDPVAAKYVRQFVGASELVNNRDRWCLWLEDMDPKTFDAAQS